MESMRINKGRRAGEGRKREKEREIYIYILA